MRLAVACVRCVLLACIGSAVVGRCFAGSRPVSLHMQAVVEADLTAPDSLVLFQSSLQRTKLQLTNSPAAEAPTGIAEAHILASSPAALSHSGAGVSVAAPPQEAAVITPFDDSLLSSPALLAYMVSSAATNIGHSASSHAASVNVLPAYFKQHWLCLLIGSIAFLCGVLIVWFNELRSVKIDSLLSRGLSEVESIDADKVNEDTRGCLVHVVGQTIGVTPVEDPQFQGANVINCLKLQSTVEVYEWVQTVKINQAPRQTQDKKSQIQYSFHKEWSTVHRNSLQFQRSAGKPSPDNPRPPRGISLGTFTSMSKTAKLGGFTLPDDMTEQFRNFEPAMRYLPPTVQACGVVFYANKDGYFYSRPSMRSMWSTKAGPSTEPVVGDLRVRFLCVPQGVGTAVAVHCEKDGMETFVPYRAIRRGCCTSVDQDRQRLIDEGSRSLGELKQTDEDMAPCMESNRLTVSCFCCPCNTIQRVCTKEVVTEQIYYISEERDPVEKPFEWVVPRNGWRVWLFRGLGWLVCYMSCLAVLGTLRSQVEGVTGLRVYGSLASAVLAAVLATSAAACVIAVAYLCYSPSQSVKWVCAMAVVIAVPFIVGHLQDTM